MSQISYLSLSYPVVFDTAIRQILERGAFDCQHSQEYRGIAFCRVNEPRFDALRVLLESAAPDVAYFLESVTAERLLVQAATKAYNQEEAHWFVSLTNAVTPFEAGTCMQPWEADFYNNNMASAAQTP